MFGANCCGKLLRARGMLAGPLALERAQLSQLHLSLVGVPLLCCRDARLFFLFWFLNRGENRASLLGTAALPTAAASGTAAT
jgi:hypothetical protein